MNLTINAAKTNALHPEQLPKSEQTARRTDSLIAEVRRNAQKMSSVFTDRTSACATSIANSKKNIDSAWSICKDAYAKKDALREEYGISKEDAALLEKAARAEADPITAEPLTEEEKEQVAALKEQPFTSDYQQQAQTLNGTIKDNRMSIADEVKNINKQTMILSTVKLEHLKVHIGEDAKRQITDLKEDAAKEMMSDGFLAAKDKIDEDNQIREEEQKKQEEEEKKEEKMAAKREEKQNAQEEFIEKAKENNDTVNDQINETDAAMAETEQKVNEINAKLKQMEDLLNGTSVDTYA